MSNDVWLSLDYGQREITKTFNAKVQGLYVGKILIGGPDATYISLNSDFGYFDGCIQVMQRINFNLEKKNLISFSPFF